MTSLRSKKVMTLKLKSLDRVLNKKQIYIKIMQKVCTKRPKDSPRLLLNFDK